MEFPDVFSLKGELALITGGGTGIGLAVAKAMHAAGAKVVLIGRREAELTAAVKSIGAGASFFVHDITKFELADALVEKVTRELGPITCLVNNAGVHLKKPAIDTTPEEFQSVLNTHIFGAHALTRAVAPGMIQRKHGNILFMASMASRVRLTLTAVSSSPWNAHRGTLAIFLTASVSPPPQMGMPAANRPGSRHIRSKVPKPPIDRPVM